YYLCWLANVANSPENMLCILNKSFLVWFNNLMALQSFNCIPESVMIRPAYDFIGEPVFFYGIGISLLKVFSFYSSIFPYFIGNPRKICLTDQKKVNLCFSDFRIQPTRR